MEVDPGDARSLVSSEPVENQEWLTQEVYVDEDRPAKFITTAIARYADDEEMYIAIFDLDSFIRDTDESSGGIRDSETVYNCSP